MNTFLLLSLLMIISFGEVHSRAVGNVEKAVDVTPDYVGIDHNLAINWTGMPSVPVIAWPPVAPVSRIDKERNDWLFNAKTFEEQFNKAMGNT